MYKNMILGLRRVQRIAEADAHHIAWSDERFTDEESDGELFVVAWRAHRDGNLNRHSVWPSNGDLRRLFTDQEVVAISGHTVAPCSDTLGGCASARIRWSVHLVILAASVDGR